MEVQGQAEARSWRKGKRRAVGGAAGGRPPAGTIIVQPLKDLNEYEPDEGTILNTGESRGGVVFSTRDRAAAARNRRATRTGAGQSGGALGTTRRLIGTAIGVPRIDVVGPSSFGAVQVGRDV